MPVVQKTWLSEGTNVVFYSDVEDDSIPTVKTGVPNTEHGEYSYIKLTHLPLGNLNEILDM